MVRKYTDKELLDKVQELESFDSFPKGRWILGVRSKKDIPNSYDDKFYIYEETKFIDVLTGTTNPGLTILKGGFKKYNKHGAAVLKADQWYYNLWTYGLHRGRMPSLKQLGNKVIVFRDGNMNGKSEEIGPEQKGYYGINFHSNTYDFSNDSKKVLKSDINSWSAGCQVANQRAKYIEHVKEFQILKEKGIQKWVTYCLINEF